MSDFYQDGINIGYGRSYLNVGHDNPCTDSDYASYRRGIKEGQYRKEIHDELDREYFGE